VRFLAENSAESHFEVVWTMMYAKTPEIPNAYQAAEGPMSKFSREVAIRTTALRHCSDWGIASTMRPRGATVNIGSVQPKNWEKNNY